MSQTKTKPQAKKQPKKQAAPVEATAAEVLTLAETAAYLRVSEAEIAQLVHSQDLPGRMVGDEWRFLKTALQDWLRTPPLPGSKEAFLSLAGCMKDDPYLLDELDEIYKRRRQSSVEDGE